MSRAHLLGCAMLLALTSFAPSAHAQDTLDIQNFRPHAASETIFSTEGARTLAHLSAGGGLIFNYADGPLILTPVSGDAIRVVERQLAAHAMLGIGLFDRLQLDASMPLYFIHTGDATNIIVDGDVFSGMAVGDTALRLKGLIFSTDTFGLGAALEGSFPTGDEATFIGESGPTLTPSLITDVQVGDVMLAANVGARFRRESEVRSVELGPELDYKLGAQWNLPGDTFALDAEIFGRYRISQENTSSFDVKGSPLEFLVGGKYMTHSGVGVMLGAGTSILSGYGSPRFRTILGVTYAKPQAEEVAIDTDADGIFDAQDSCPEQPEDIDQFEDEDGCPDPDNDSDGILDADDKCPIDAEDMDGFEDEDGCPDPDNDSDGILDTADACPMEAEDMDGVEDEDGCPETDRDSDGVQDKSDACPDEPEDLDGFEDEDGCPDPDNDQDGVLDVDDKCPLTAGPPEGKGCPVAAKGTRVVVTTKNIEFNEKIFFDHDRAVLKSQFKPALKEVARLLKKYPELKRIEIEGHTSQTGEERYNQKLSQQRADAVRSYLIKQGVAAKRLKAVGYGPDRPLVANEVSEEDRAKNRRVTFTILEQDPIKEEQEVPAEP